jgi:hypothetical protein
MWGNRRHIFTRPLLKTNAYRFIFKVKPRFSLSGRLGGTKSRTEHGGSEQRALSLGDHLIFRSAMLWRHCTYCVGRQSRRLQGAVRFAVT